MKPKLILIAFATFAQLLTLLAQEKSSSHYSSAEKLVDLLPIKQGFISLIEQAETDSGRQLEKSLDWISIRSAYAKAYADTYSEEQLREFIVFFESPAGKAWSEGQQKILTLTSTETQAALQKLQDAFMKSKE